MDFTEKSDTLHLMIRGSTPKKVSLNEVSIETLNLKDLASKALENIGEDQYTFIYRGKPLKSDVSLKSQGVKNGSVIQAVKIVSKNVPVTKEYPKFTERDIQDTIWMYRKITLTNFHKASRPEFLKKVLERYPNLQNNLSAISILRDPVLLATLGNPDTVRRMADVNRELIDATKFIVDTLNNKTMNLPNNPTDDLDSSSSSDDQNMPSAFRNANRRITSTQLAEALGQVFSGGANSLANISQRNLNDGSENSSAASNSGTSSNRVTSSMFLNALSEVLRSNNEVRHSRSANEIEGTENTSNPPEAVSVPPVIPPIPAAIVPTGNPETAGSATQQPLYLSELQAMRNMGLTDTELCFQALVVCNGDLEAAINLVFSGRGIN